MLDHSRNAWTLPAAENSLRINCSPLKKSRCGICGEQPLSKVAAGTKESERPGGAREQVVQFFATDALSPVMHRGTWYHDALDDALESNDRPDRGQHTAAEEASDWKSSLDEADNRNRPWCQPELKQVCLDLSLVCGQASTHHLAILGSGKQSGNPVERSSQSGRSIVGQIPRVSIIRDLQTLTSSIPAWHLSDTWLTCCKHLKACGADHF